MVVTSAHYTDADKKMVKAVIDGTEWLVPNDMGHPFRREIDQWVKDGNVIADTPVAVPQRLSRRKFKMQLEIAGLTAAVEAWVDAQPKLIKIAFRESGEFVRTDAMLQKGFTDLGFSKETIDAFFIAGDAL